MVNEAQQVGTRYGQRRDPSRRVRRMKSKMPTTKSENRGSYAARQLPSRLTRWSPVILGIVERLPHHVFSSFPHVFRSTIFACGAVCLTATIAREADPSLPPIFAAS